MRPRFRGSAGFGRVRGAVTSFLRQRRGSGQVAGRHSARLRAGSGPARRFRVQACAPCRLLSVASVVALVSGFSSAASASSAWVIALCVSWAVDRTDRTYRTDRTARKLGRIASSASAPPPLSRDSRLSRFDLFSARSLLGLCGLCVSPRASPRSALGYTISPLQGSESRHEGMPAHGRLDLAS